MEKILEVSNLNVYVKEKTGRTIKDKLILSNVNITINKGDFIFLKGNNGSGKSTLLNVLARIPLPSVYGISGEIVYFGDKSRPNFNILERNADIQWYKEQICYIRQADMAKGRISNVFYNIMTAKKDISEDEIKLFLHSHNIANFIDGELPNNLIHKNISSLSEGQKKIIEIFAGIMRCESDSVQLLFIDEPFNHLDVKNIARVVGLIHDLHKRNPELAIIATTHCQAFSDADSKIKPYIVARNTIIPSELPYQQGKCFREEDLLK